MMPPSLAVDVAVYPYLKVVTKCFKHFVAVRGVELHFQCDCSRINFRQHNGVPVKIFLGMPVQPNNLSVNQNVQERVFLPK